VLPRIANLRAAAAHQAQVNHVTGDVHYLALGLNGRRTLLTIHDCVSLERLRGFKRAVFRWLWYSLPVRRAAMVTVISESTRRELLRHVRCDPAKVRVVHNCVSSDFVRQDKPFNVRKPVVLQVGTGISKNLLRAAEALTSLSCHLKIIGQLGPEQSAALRRHRIEFSNIERASDAEMVQAYRDCDLLLFVSTYEGFGLPIVEAQAMGRPVITSQLLSMPEVAGDAACLVNPFETVSIREGVNKVIQDADYRECLVRAGFENVKRFAPKTIAAQYAAIYEELADTPPTGHFTARK
jgi:glycosyltransferase involved in cell wall biosynthesis